MDILIPALPSGEILLRLGFATLLGGLLGLDREVRGKAAGFRTHILVAIGAATSMLVAVEVFADLAPTELPNGIDPLRALSGVIGGIGFLGAGAVLKDRRTVQGLTTAANIWLVGAIGIACGAGYYAIAALAFLFAFAALVLLGIVERLLPSWRRPED